MPERGPSKPICVVLPPSPAICSLTARVQSAYGRLPFAETVSTMSSSSRKDDSGTDEKVAPASMRRAWLEEAERRLVLFAVRHSVLLFRISLGTLFVWFGALKVLGVSPMQEFVTTVLNSMPLGVTTKQMGVFEVALGLFLYSGRAMRLCLSLFFVHMLGTFSVLIVLPELCFREGNPLLLTAHGQYIFKNLVLVSAGIIAAASIRRTRENMWSLRSADSPRSTR